MVTILIFFNANIGGALDLMLRYTRDEYILGTHNVVLLMWMVQYDIRWSRAIRYPMMQENELRSLTAQPYAFASVWIICIFNIDMPAFCVWLRSNKCNVGQYLFGVFFYLFILTSTEHNIEPPFLQKLDSSNAKIDSS